MSEPGEGLQEADLVMQGGVTSGVVYPGTLHELGRAFRFRRIGGTSAGAIAAALLAAAELRRQDLLAGGDPDPGQPFDDLRDLGERLAAPLDPARPDGPRVLEGLFAPDPETAPLFEVVRGALAGGRRGALLPLARLLAAQPGIAQAREALRRSGLLPLLSRLAREGPWRDEARVLLGGDVPDSALSWLLRHPLAAGLAVLALAALLAWLTFRLTHPWLPEEGAAVLAALLPLLVLGGVGLRLAGRVLASVAQAASQTLGAVESGVGDAQGTLLRHGFGLASGYAGGEPGPLTPWLHGELRRVGGSDGVLTFGDLRGRGVELKLVTTCLTRERPYVLPLDQRSADHKDFYFRPEEWARLFPPDVLEHLTAHAERTYMDPGLPPPPGRRGWSYYRLPPEAHLPVLVAARLSLSFPGLFSAVPLHFLQWGRREDQATRPDFPPMWTGRYGEEGERTEDLRPTRVHPCLFSDGGLTSNLPLMLFDEVIPGRPLFAVHLQERRRDAPAFLAGPLPWQYYHRPIRDVPGFALSIVDSARNWFDQSLLTLPGYAERVVSVTIPAGLGGLHLGMDAANIRLLLAKGAEAGQRLVTRFGPGSTDPWNTAGLTALRWRNVTPDLGDLLVAYAKTYPPGALPALLAAMPPDPQGQTLVPNLSTLTSQELRALSAFSAASDAIRAATRPGRDALFPAATPWNEPPFRGLRGVLRYRPFL